MIPGNILSLTITGQTLTTIPIINSNTYTISVVNSPPAFVSIPSDADICIPIGMNLSVGYQYYCSQNTPLILISDNEGDTI